MIKACLLALLLLASTVPTWQGLLQGAAWLLHGVVLYAHAAQRLCQSQSIRSVDRIWLGAAGLSLAVGGCGASWWAVVLAMGAHVVAIVTSGMPPHGLRLVAVGGGFWFAWVSLATTGTPSKECLLLACALFASEPAVERASGWLARLGSPASRWYVVALLVHIALGVPWMPGMPAVGCDPSWQFALHDAFVRGSRFGDEVIFSFGPLGFLYTNTYTPSTFGILLASRIAWAVCTAHLLWLVARHSGSSAARVGCWSAVMALTVAFDSDSRFFLLPLCFLCARGVAPASLAVRVLAPVALAAALLMKFSIGVAAAWAVAVSVLDDTTQRRFPFAGASWLCSILFLWCVVAGQELSAFSNFIGRSIEITQGYTEAMALTPYDWFASSWELVALFGCIAWAVAHAGLPGGTRWDRLVTAFGCFGVLVLVGRASLVRQDAGHNLVGVALGAGAFLLVAVREVTTLRWAGVVVALVVAGSLSRNSVDAALLRVAREVLIAPARMLHGVDLLVTGRLHDTYDATIAGIRRDYPLAAGLGGPVDVFPHQQAIAIAHGLDYRPRPVWQSYKAYTPALARLNRAHLEGASAPSSILLLVDPIDRHLATQEDGPCWPLLRAGYDVARVDSECVTLQRRRQPRSWRLEPDRTLVVPWGAPVEVSATGTPAWVTIESELTPAGRAMRALYKVPTISLILTTADGVEVERRLIRATATEGFVVSPLIADVADASRFFSAQPPLCGQVVTRLQLRVNGPQAVVNLVYGPSARIAVSRLLFSPQ